MLSNEVPIIVFQIENLRGKFTKLKLKCRAQKSLSMHTLDQLT